MDHAYSRGTSVTRKKRGSEGTEVSLLCPLGAGSMSSPGSVVTADRGGDTRRGREWATATGQPGPQGTSQKCWTFEAWLTGMLEMAGGLCVQWSLGK